MAHFKVSSVKASIEAQRQREEWERKVIEAEASIDQHLQTVSEETFQKIDTIYRQTVKHTVTWIQYRNSLLNTINDLHKAIPRAQRMIENARASGDVLKVERLQKEHDSYPQFLFQAQQQLTQANEMVEFMKLAAKRQEEKMREAYKIVAQGREMGLPQETQQTSALEEL